MNNIKKVLVSQPSPASLEKSPFSNLVEKYSLNLEFQPFIKTVSVPVKEFRKQRIDIPSHTAVILTSRNSVDNYFRICEECRFTVPETMMYFCVSETIALYLQKYIIYRKRKIFFGKSKFIDLMDLLLKHSSHNFLVPVSAPHKPEIPKMLSEAKLKHSIAILSTTESVELKEKLDIKKYDMLLFYSPSEIQSLKDNFGDEAQDIRIAAFGINTAKAVSEAGLNLVALAPTPDCPSMVMAVAKYLEESKGNKTPDTSYIEEAIKQASSHDEAVLAKVKVKTTRGKKVAAAKKPEASK